MRSVLWTGRHPQDRIWRDRTFPVGKDFRQGCILPPHLFNLYAEHIIQKTRLHSEKGRVKVGRKNISNLRNADDTVSNVGKGALRELEATQCYINMHIQ